MLSPRSCFRTNKEDKCWLREGAKNEGDLCCLEGGAKRGGVLAAGGACALAGPLLAYPEVAQVDRVIRRRPRVRRLRRSQALHLIHHLQSQCKIGPSQMDEALLC